LRADEILFFVLTFTQVSYQISLMKFIVLGSGSSVPQEKRTSSAYWLETENGSLLIDFSPSAIHRMAQEKLDWANLDAIWISHFHLDHCGGLAPFLFATKYAAEVQKRTKPLKIFGAVGLKKLINRLDKVNDYGLLLQPFPLEIIEIKEFEAFEILPNIEAVAFSTPHTEDSHAIRITDKKEKSIVFTSDTGFEKAIGSFAKETNLFVVECSFVKDKPTAKHLELAEAMFLIQIAKPQKAVLTHLYAEWDNVNFNEEVTKFNPICEVIEAKDGLEVEII
jgi:ribonuclease BN (tRNA processing enzyme)